MLRAEDATAPQLVAHLSGGRGVAVLPVGALEQHGPHLPLATDTLTAQAVADRVADALDAALLPAVGYGATWNMSGYPGTVTLRPETVEALAVDIGRGAAAAGARLLVVVNGDWGNRAPLARAAAALQADGVRAVVLDHPGLDEAAERLRESRPAAPGLMHAEEIETSLVLAIAPRLVQGGAAAVYPDFPPGFGSVPMRMHPFSESGVFGDPGPATAAKGAALLDAVVTESLRLIEGLLASL
ncbi:creatininase family protein [uncultured Amnibacterium sp.]|uniref:creatininase family protein n=1 Tax=uncultured Amnibacterium sp. TaxID=1631851 RepID=UPI0035CC003C